MHLEITDNLDNEMHRQDQNDGRGLGLLFGRGVVVLPNDCRDMFGKLTKGSSGCLIDCIVKGTSHSASEGDGAAGPAAFSTRASREVYDSAEERLVCGSG